MALCRRLGAYGPDRCCGLILQARCYALNYKQPKEEAQAYGKFRRELSVLRKQFREEWLKKQEMQQQALNAQSAEQARLEKMMEQKALEQNKEDLERMAKRRELTEKKRAQEIADKRKRGDESRRAWESQLHQRQIAQVLIAQEESKGYITPNNLEQKIQEIIAKEVDYNFALQPPTTKSRDNPRKSPSTGSA
ncbi:hypothetical protein EMCRGX_G029580 [Ephydatia muelleri]|eukprot:Em0013g178a